MKAEDIERARVLGLVRGDTEALEWLGLWNWYVHAIDDLVDEHLKAREQTSEARGQGAELLLTILAKACLLYSHPFYLKHLPALRMIVINCTNAYADVVKCEGSGVRWQEEFADVYRHFGVEMALAVAAICGGYEHMRACSPELRWRNWRHHHDAEGNPI